MPGEDRRSLRLSLLTVGVDGAPAADLSCAPTGTRRRPQPSPGASRGIHITAPAGTRARPSGYTPAPALTEADERVTKVAQTHLSSPPSGGFVILPSPFRHGCDTVRPSRYTGSLPGSSQLPEQLADAGRAATYLAVGARRDGVGTTRDAFPDLLEHVGLGAVLVGLALLPGASPAVAPQGRCVQQLGKGIGGA